MLNYMNLWHTGMTVQFYIDTVIVYDKKANCEDSNDIDIAQIKAEILRYGQ